MKSNPGPDSRVELFLEDLGLAVVPSDLPNAAARIDARTPRASGNAQRQVGVLLGGVVVAVSLALLALTERRSRADLQPFGIGRSDQHRTVLGYGHTERHSAALE